MSALGLPLKRRPRSRALAFVGVVGALLVAGIFWAFTAAATPSSSADQCAKPLSERVGGWYCPGATP